ncbi:hypothetical protein EV182_003485 [Spiromyces aspiralis]|uniref:Uncharacterized protein n=1 Tax=Spiromyces aspiralis TaxID=68401 RepID=A0ACC1HQ97_9FUNG|nr:hypothetical protein EV182_003485 [Spiromyces aspiralis]
MAMETSPLLVDCLGDISYKPWAQMILFILKDHNVEKCILKPTKGSDNKLARKIILKCLKTETWSNYYGYMSAFDLWEQIQYDHDDSDSTLIKLVSIL